MFVFVVVVCCLLVAVVRAPLHVFGYVCRLLCVCCSAIVNRRLSFVVCCFVRLVCCVLAVVYCCLRFAVCCLFAAC